MPTIKERIQDDWKQAMKSIDKFKSDTLSTAKSEILLFEKNKGVVLEDEQVIEVLAKEIKQRREAMLEFEKGNRQDLVEHSKGVINLLSGYLPQQLDEEEILQLVKDTACEVGATSMKNMCKIMNALKPKTVGIATVNLLVA